MSGVSSSPIPPRPPVFVPFVFFVVPNPPKQCPSASSRLCVPTHLSTRQSPALFGSLLPTVAREKRSPTKDSTAHLGFEATAVRVSAFIPCAASWRSLRVEKDNRWLASL